MKVNELKTLLSILPNDADIEVNSIRAEGEDHKASKTVDAQIMVPHNLFPLDVEQNVDPERRSFNNIAKYITEIKACNIDWDVDDEAVKEDLPECVVIPLVIAINNGVDEDAISDFISDETGFCHFGFDILITVTC